jgi:hypothetical protein
MNKETIATVIADCRNIQASLDTLGVCSDAPAVLLHLAERVQELEASIDHCLENYSGGTGEEASDICEELESVRDKGGSNAN